MSVMGRITLSIISSRIYSICQVTIHKYKCWTEIYDNDEDVCTYVQEGAIPRAKGAIEATIINNYHSRQSMISF